MELTNRVRRALFDRVGNAEKTDDDAIHRHEHHRLPVNAKFVGTVDRVIGNGRPTVHQRTVADGDRPATDRSDDSLSSDRLEVVGLFHRDPALGSAFDDGCRERVLAGPLQACRVTQKTVCGAAIQSLDRYQTGLPLRKGSGLVDDQGVHLAHDFNRLGVLEQHSGASTLARGDHDRHRRRQSKSARTCNDQNGDCVDEGVGHGRFRAPDRPHDERDRSDPNDRRNEVTGNHVCELLNRRATPLRVGHHLNDLC